MLKNVKCARCVKCGKEYEATANLTNCSCGGILDIIYDYDYIKKNLTKETLKSRPNTMWRYRELLPVEETTPDTPLRVGWSPLYEEQRLADQLGLKKLAENLYKHLDDDEMKVGDFILPVFKEISYLSLEEFRRLNQQIRQLANEPEVLRQKRKGDYLMEHGKYVNAIKVYQRALRREAEDDIEVTDIRKPEATEAAADIL